MRFAKPNLLLACLIFFASGSLQQAHAWNGPGHMAVLRVAYDLLSPAEQAKLVAILSQHRDISRITAGLNTTMPNSRDLVMAFATWPDLIKQDRMKYTDNGYNEAGPFKKVADDQLMHKGWHFIDTPYSRDGTPKPPAPSTDTVDAVTVVNILLKQLNSAEDDKQKAFDFVWLFHLVGDLHQPLHCVDGIDKVYPKGDTGGNNILLEGETNGETELHAYWDDILGKGAGRDKVTKRVLLDKDVMTANSIATNTVLQGIVLDAKKDDLNPQHWADEGFALAQKDAYDFPSVRQDIQQHRGESIPVEYVTLDDNYHTKAEADARQQIKLGGYRLSRLLKSILSH